MLTTPQTPSHALTGVGSVIRYFVRLREVSGDVACLDLGRKIYEYRSILQVDTVNFSLMSEEDKDALIESFKAFLNGLSFPVQILIKNLPYRLDEYLKTTGLGTEPGSLLFPAAVRKTGKLSRRPLMRTDAADMLKRRLKQAGLPAHYAPHSFRATGHHKFSGK